MKKIIKALKYCVDKDCEEGCPYDLVTGCYKKLVEDTIDLLNNQKEEIERLQKLLDEKCDIIKELNGLFATRPPNRERRYRQCLILMILMFAILTQMVIS